MACHLLCRIHNSSIRSNVQLRAIYVVQNQVLQNAVSMADVYLLHGRMSQPWCAGCVVALFPQLYPQASKTSTLALLCAVVHTVTMVTMVLYFGGSTMNVDK